MGTSGKDWWLCQRAQISFAQINIRVVLNNVGEAGKAEKLIAKEAIFILDSRVDFFCWHVGEGNAGDEEVMGKYGFRARNEREMAVQFATRFRMAFLSLFLEEKGTPSNI